MIQYIENIIQRVINHRLSKIIAGILGILTTIVLFDSVSKLSFWSSGGVSIAPPAPTSTSEPLISTSQSMSSFSSTVPPVEAITIRGQVLDKATSNPVTNAEVRAEIRLQSGVQPINTVLTDNDGRFAIVVNAQGSLLEGTIQVDARDYQQARTEISIPLPQQQLLRVMLLTKQ